jgi:hypothetical protein
VNRPDGAANGRPGDSVRPQSGETRDSDPVPEQTPARLTPRVPEAGPAPEDGAVQRLAAVVSGARPPGLYRWLSRAHPAAVRRELATVGWDLHHLDGARIRDKAGLLDACSDSLQFPAYFGYNWDALADCLADLSWLPDRGRVVLWDRYGVLAASDPDAWATGREVFQSAAEERTAEGRSPLYTLVRGLGPTDAPVL